MKFFTWFVVATIAFVLIARFKPQSKAEPIIPTETREAQGNPAHDGIKAPPARTEEQGRRDAQQGGTFYVSPEAARRVAGAC